MVTGVCSIGVLNNHRGDLFLNSLLPLVPRGLNKGGFSARNKDQKLVGRF